jgi:LssY-like putative type I secretion system component LssY
MKIAVLGSGRRAIAIILAVVVLYGCISYLILPTTWTGIEREPGLAKHTMLTATAQGIPGCPINVELLGSRADVVRAFHAAGWFAADPITLRTSAEIAGSVIFDRPYTPLPSVLSSSRIDAKTWLSKSQTVRVRIVGNTSAGGRFSRAERKVVRFGLVRPPLIAASRLVATPVKLHTGLRQISIENAESSLQA